MINLRGMKLNAVAALVLTLASFAARAEKMDAEIHTVVIQKLEQAVSKAREDETVSLKPVRARLADLYAERARLRAMNEAEDDRCNTAGVCNGALDDRKRALKLYDRVLAEADKENRGSLMLQMAQLNELNVDFKKAEALYDRLVTEGPSKHSNVILAEGLIGRAEARFNHGDMDRAQKDFESAAHLVGNGRKGQILHRIAWCQLNKGDQVQAVQTLVHVLQTPALLTRESSTGTSFDASFQEDIARDLATFFARGVVTRREIALLESLAPENARKETMKHFASECDRLGQKKAAIEAWNAELKFEESTSARLEGMVHIAQLRLDLNQKREALQGLRESVAVWQKQGCDDVELCSSIQIRMRTLVITWNKSEKKEPSGLLVDAYLTYVGAFAEDMEMTQWAAEAARAQKRYAVAATLYHKSALLASTSKAKGAKEILESGLVGEVEMAELSKDARTREVSYDHYIQLNPNGAINAKIRYQRAHVAYETGDMNGASARFHEFAASQICGKKASEETLALCLQAADLDLDALVGLKAHAVVQARGAEYARLFPKHRNEYLKIARTAVLKQAEGQQPQVAIAKLAEADLSGATTEERVRFLKTWLSLAEKSRDLVGTRAAAAQLLKTDGLSAQDHELALAKLAWVAETSLDFNEAFATVKKMKLAALRPEERAMKLSLLAELSGHDSRPYDEVILRTSRDQQQKAFIVAKLVRTSKRPLVEFAKREGALRAYPSIYAPLALEVFAKTGNTQVAERALKIKAVAKEPAGRVLARELYLREFAAMDAKIAHHRLHTSGDKALQASLKERIQLLAQAEKVANKSIASHDWASQVLSLSMLSRENHRLYNEIVALPAPKKLKTEERAQYAVLLEKSAHGYLHKYEQITKKVDLLWGQGESQAALEKDMNSAQGPVRALVANELRRLSYVAPNGIRGQMDEELRSGVTPPNETQVSQARQAAKANPFSVPTLAKLRELEVVRGRETMVAYLDARLLKLKSLEQKTGEKR